MTGGSRRPQTSALPIRAGRCKRLRVPVPSVRTTTSGCTRSYAVMVPRFQCRHDGNCDGRFRVAPGFLLEAPRRPPPASGTPHRRECSAEERRSSIASSSLLEPIVRRIAGGSPGRAPRRTHRDGSPSAASKQGFRALRFCIVAPHARRHDPRTGRQRQDCSASPDTSSPIRSGHATHWRRTIPRHVPAPR